MERDFCLIFYLYKYLNKKKLLCWCIFIFFKHKKIKRRSKRTLIIQMLRHAEFLMDRTIRVTNLSAFIVVATTLLLQGIFQFSFLFFDYKYLSILHRIIYTSRSSTRWYNRSTRWNISILYFSTLQWNKSSSYNWIWCDQERHSSIIASSIRLGSSIFVKSQIILWEWEKVIHCICTNYFHIWRRKITRGKVHHHYGKQHVDRSLIY